MKMKLKKLSSRLRKKSGIDNLEKREKIFLAVGVVFVFCFLFFQGVVSPYVTARDKLERSLARKKNDVVEMEILQQEYKELKNRQGGIARQIDKRDSQFSLFSFLEKQATDVQIKNRVTYMKPSTSDLDETFRESSVEMKIEEITLAQLVDFLVRIESEQNVVVIKRIAIQKNSKVEDLLDVIVNIITFEKKLGGGAEVASVVNN